MSADVSVRIAVGFNLQLSPVWIYLALLDSFPNADKQRSRIESSEILTYVYGSQVEPQENLPSQRRPLITPLDNEVGVVTMIERTSVDNPDVRVERQYLSPDDILHALNEVCLALRS